MWSFNTILRGCLCKQAKARRVECKEGDWLEETKERAKGYVHVSDTGYISAGRHISVRGRGKGSMGLGKQVCDVM